MWGFLLGGTNACWSEAWPGRHSDYSGAAVYQAYRVIVYREQARLLQVIADICGSEAWSGRHSDDTCDAARSHTALSFIASKLGSYRGLPISVGAVLARDKNTAIILQTASPLSSECRPDQAPLPHEPGLPRDNGTLWFRSASKGQVSLQREP